MKSVVKGMAINQSRARRVPDQVVSWGSCHWPE
jgi:hypothetical protein